MEVFVKIPVIGTVAYNFIKGNTPMICQVIGWRWRVLNLRSSNEEVELYVHYILELCINNYGNVF